MGLKRRPNNSKTTWQCSACKKAKQLVKATTCTSYVSEPTKSTTDYPVMHDSDGDDEDDVSITQVTVGAANKQIKVPLQSLLRVIIKQFSAQLGGLLVI